MPLQLSKRDQSIATQLENFITALGAVQKREACAASFEEWLTNIRVALAFHDVTITDARSRGVFEPTLVTMLEIINSHDKRGANGAGGALTPATIQEELFQRLEHLTKALERLSDSYSRSAQCWDARLDVFIELILAEQAHVKFCGNVQRWFQKDDLERPTPVLLRRSLVDIVGF